MATVFNKTYFKLGACLVFLLNIFTIQLALGQNWTSYEETTAIKVSGITADSQIGSLTTMQKQTTRQYFDGLGRPVQTIAVQASPAGHDIIQPTVYDNLGRQTTGYLPYADSTGDASFRSNALTRQSTFYSTGQGGKVAIDVSPFSQQVFESSPLQRLLKAGSVGDGFQPTQHYKTASYRPNTVADAVRIYLPAGTSTATYAANLLSVTQGTDEQGVSSQVFTDIMGHTILKRQIVNETINGATVTALDTYYIYNDDGTLAYVVPPNAVAVMKGAGNWTVTQSALTKLIYSYVYDNQQRLVQRTVPGGSTLYIVYDPMNRPVLMQDGNMRINNQWNYVKYDAEGRPITQGIYTDATPAHTTLSGMQSYVSGLSYATNYYESKSATLTNHGYYTNVCFPTTGISPLAYAYYDDYDQNQNGAVDYSYQPQSLTGEASPTSLTRGALTAITKTTVGAGLTNVWITNVMFYDKNGHLIQVRSNNHTNTATTIGDSKTIAPDFTGKPIQDKTIKVLNGTTTTVLNTYTYDQAYRIKAIDEAYNGGTAIRIAAYTYNEIGQMVFKQLHSKDAGSTFMQSIDYRYNIQGKLLTLNNSTLTAGSENTAGTNAVFGMQFFYDKADNGTHFRSNTPYFNGRLSEVKWMAKTSTLTERSYTFAYDDQNRLTGASYADRPEGGGVWGNVTAYDEKGITYDYNGNIMTLQRNAVVSGSIKPIDNLQYNYIGDQLNTVTDGTGTGTSYAVLGFQNMTNNTATPYSYDTNGNLNADPYKGLTLAYNVLNRTDKVTITTATNRYINYTYDATGVLIRKQQYDNSVLQNTTDYVDGFVVLNNTLSYFGMLEGRVINTGGTFKPEYVVTDQQGNARVSFQESGSTGTSVITQENSYYPFGLIMPNSQVTTPTLANKQLYNGGSEWQNDYGNLPDYYQTFYRNYDAALGRFVGVDPDPESAASLTTYQYAGNNPLSNNDPMGNEINGADNDGLEGYQRLKLLKAQDGAPGTFRSGNQSQQWFTGVENSLFDPANQPQYIPGFGLIGGQNQINTTIAQRGQGIKDFNINNYITYVDGGLEFKHPDQTGDTEPNGYYSGNTNDIWIPVLDYNRMLADASRSNTNPDANQGGNIFENSSEGVGPYLRTPQPQVLLAGIGNEEEEVAEVSYTVYKGVTENGGVYWGMTKDFISRAAQHGDRFISISQEFININSKAAARGLEQLMIDAAGGIQNLENSINSISINNPNLMQYYQQAIRFLSQ